MDVQQTLDAVARHVAGYRGSLEKAFEVVRASKAVTESEKAQLYDELARVAREHVRVAEQALTDT